MLRTVLLSLINLLLPYLVYAIWQQALKVHAYQRARKQQPPVIDVTPVHRWPWRRLLGCGIALLALSLLYLRYSEIPSNPNPWLPANPAHNANY
jgi:hypothetical protein